MRGQDKHNKAIHFARGPRNSRAVGHDHHPFRVKATHRPDAPEYSRSFKVKHRVASRY